MSRENGDKRENIEESSTLMNDHVFVIPTSINAINNKLLWRDAVKQIIAVCIVHSLVIKAGANLAISAIMLPQLKDENQIHITPSDESWIASLVTISLPTGSLLIGPLMDKFGRKRLCLMTALIGVITWLLHAFATTVWNLCAVRFLGGFSGGLTMAAIIYVSEISHPDFRPMLLSLNSVFVSFGILLTCVFGFGLNWRTIAIIFAAFDAACFLAICFIPESPLCLLTLKSNPSAAARSLKWLYPNPTVFEFQYERMLETRTYSQPKATERTSLIERIKENVSVYGEPTVYKPLIILFIIFFYQQISGSYVIIFYSVDLFRRIGGHFESGFNEFAALVLLGSIRFVMSVITAFISKKIGRRLLLFASTLGMFVSSLVAGLYMYLTAIPQQEFDKLNITKDAASDNIAVFCVLAYVCFASLGVMVIPWALIGELLPVSVRGKLGGVLIAVAYVLMFVFVKLFPLLMNVIGLEYLFFILSVLNLFGFVFIYCCLPETLGKSFNEIERHFVRER